MKSTLKQKNSSQQLQQQSEKQNNSMSSKESSKKTTYFAVFHDSSVASLQAAKHPQHHNLSNSTQSEATRLPAKKVIKVLQQQNKECFANSDSPPSVVARQDESSMLDNSQQPLIVQMLEDTGGSSSDHHLQLHQYGGAGVPVPTSGPANQPLQSAHKHHQRPYGAEPLPVGGQKKKKQYTSSNNLISSNKRGSNHQGHHYRQQGYTTTSSMSQFSRGGSDVSIKGRKLSPNTECGKQRTATGSESGVQLIVNQAEQQQQQQPQAQGTASATDPGAATAKLPQPYSSECVRLPIGGAQYAPNNKTRSSSKTGQAAQQQIQLRSAKQQPRSSTSLLRHRQQQAPQCETQPSFLGVTNSASQRTAHFAHEIVTSNNAASLAPGAGPQLRGSQSTTTVSNPVTSLKSKSKAVGAKQKQQTLLTNISDENNSKNLKTVGSATTLIIKQQQQHQTHQVVPQSTHSIARKKAAISHTSKTQQDISGNVATSSTTANLKKKRQSVPIGTSATTVTAPSNAIQHQHQKVGVKPSPNAVMMAPSTRNAAPCTTISQQPPQSRTTGTTSLGRVATSKQQQLHSTKQQVAMIQSQQQRNSGAFMVGVPSSTSGRHHQAAEQQSSGGGTGELAISRRPPPTLYHQQPQRRCGSSTSSNASHHSTAKQQLKQQQQQAQLKNSRSSFQLTFSKQVSSSQNNAHSHNINGHQQHYQQSQGSPEFLGGGGASTGAGSRSRAFQGGASGAGGDPFAAASVSVCSKNKPAKRKAHAVSQSPRGGGGGSQNNRASNNSFVGWTKQGDALRLYKELQRQQQQQQQLQRKHPNEELSQQSRSTSNGSKPRYHNQPHQQPPRPGQNHTNHRGSTTTKNQSTISHESSSRQVQQRGDQNQIQMMRKILTSYQRSVIQPAQLKLGKRKSKLAAASKATEQRSLSPRQGTTHHHHHPVVAPPSRAQALAQAKKERKEQKQRVRELRQKRKAIEARTREMKLKSIKSQQAALMVPASTASRQPPHASGGGKTSTTAASKSKTDLQQINNSKPSSSALRHQPGAPLQGPAARNVSNNSQQIVTTQDETTTQDLLNAVGFQKHQNMPLQVKSSAKQVFYSNNSRGGIVDSRHAHRSNSSERVEWDPLVKNPSAALRQKVTSGAFAFNTAGHNKKTTSAANLNVVRSSAAMAKRGEALGLDYLRVKRELAVELPLSGPKKTAPRASIGLKSESGCPPSTSSIELAKQAMITPVASSSQMQHQQLLQQQQQSQQTANNTATSNTTKKRAQQSHQQLISHPKQGGVTLEPRILMDSDRAKEQNRPQHGNSRQSASSMRHEGQHQARGQPVYHQATSTTLEPSQAQLESEERQQLLVASQQCPNRERQHPQPNKRLIEQQKRLWMQKEKEELNSQLNEQQRILKNLKHVNMVARTQAQKAVKQQSNTHQTKPSSRPAGDKVIKSARYKSRDRAGAHQSAENSNLRANQLHQQQPWQQRGERMTMVAESAPQSCSVLADQKHQERLQQKRHSSVKKNARGDKGDDLINVHIRSFKDAAAVASSLEHPHQMQAYASPVRQSTYPSGSGGTTGAAEQSQLKSASSSTTTQQQQQHSIRKNAARRQERQEPSESNRLLSLKLKPATLYQPQHSHSQNEEALGLMDEKGGTAWNHQRGSGAATRPTSSLQYRSTKPRLSQNAVRSARRHMIGKHRQNAKVRDLRRRRATGTTKHNSDNAVSLAVQPGGAEELDREDLIIYIILTQAARMIQRAYRRFLATKRHLMEKEQFRSELEAELEEARSCRAQLRSIENPRTGGVTPSSLLGGEKGQYHSRLHKADAEKARNDIAAHAQQQRKHTFSFGVRNDEPSAAPNQLVEKTASVARTHDAGKLEHQQVSLIGSNEDGRLRLLSKPHTTTGNQQLKISGKNARISKQSAQETATFEQRQDEDHHLMIVKRNVQLDLKKLPVQSLDNSTKQQEEAVDLQMEAGVSSASGDNDMDGKNEDAGQGRQMDHQLDNSEDEDTLHFEERTQNTQDSADVVNVDEQDDHSHEQLCDDEIQSHIIAEAGEDADDASNITSLQHIMLDEQGGLLMNHHNHLHNQNQHNPLQLRGGISAAIDDSSMMGSVAERTDNIINYSGALNTSEEFIENGVNVSGTLGGPINPYSIVNSASKPAGTSSTCTKQAPSAVSQPAIVQPPDQTRKSLMRVISGDERFLINHSNKMLLNPGNNNLQKIASNQQLHINSINNEYTNTETQREALQIISALNSGLGTHALNSGGPNSTVDNVDQYVIKTSNSCGGSENNTNSSLNNNAFYPAGMQSLSYLQQNLSSVSLGNGTMMDLPNTSTHTHTNNNNNLLSNNNNHLHSEDHHHQNSGHNKDNNYSLSQLLLKSNYHHSGVAGAAAMTVSNTQNNYNASSQSSFFLNTNASIFERNPFQDFTASKINALMNVNPVVANQNSNMGTNGIEQLLQVREDALKFMTQLEKGWIARQEKLSMITPRQSHKKRYELEQWVTSQRKNDQQLLVPSSSQLDEEIGSLSQTQVRQICGQVSQIIETVNRKADEIKELLYQRSQDREVQKMQKEGYSEMSKYKKALEQRLGGGKHNNATDYSAVAAVASLNNNQNIEVIDQQSSQEDQLPDEAAQHKEQKALAVVGDGGDPEEQASAIVEDDVEPPLDISVEEEYEEDFLKESSAGADGVASLPQSAAPKHQNMMKSPPKILNLDLVTTATAAPDATTTSELKPDPAGIASAALEQEDKKATQEDSDDHLVGKDDVRGKLPQQEPQQEDGEEYEDLTSKSEVNEKLTEEITDRILAQVLQEELSEGDLKQVFTRQVPRAQKIDKSRERDSKDAKAQVSSPGGSRVRIESPPTLEVAVTSEANFNINQSISVDQIIAGVDTSLEAVDQYVEGIFAQIRIRAKQFMNAFYTPIYRNPINVLTRIQKQGAVSVASPSASQMGSNGQAQHDNGNAEGEGDDNGEHGSNREEAGEAVIDMTNTLSSILNVQLYLTLEKARENVIREALQQIKDAAAEGEDLAIDSNLSELLSESDHIHNKAIFDAVNEALNSVRPYGKLGEPMPWSMRPRKNFFPYASEKDLEGILQTVKGCILEWANVKAGQISSNMIVKQAAPAAQSSTSNSPEQMKSGGNAGSSNAEPTSPKPSSHEEDAAEELKAINEAGVIKQAAFQQLSEETLAIQREKRLAKLLTIEIKAQEERWLDYEAEETQVKIDITDHVLEHLVEEIANELGLINARDFSVLAPTQDPSD